MHKYTGKKIVRTNAEFDFLLWKLNRGGYRWGNGDSLCGTRDTYYCSEHLPILFAFDAKNKKVYYSSDISYEVELDPNYR